MSDNRKIHPIGYVARQTGLSAHLIRAWEKRYAAVQPERTSTGRRLYSESDIEHLQLLRQASNRGHRIAQLCGLEAETLLEIAGKRSAAASLAANRQTDISTPEEFLDVCLSAVFDLDEQALESALNRAAVTLTRTVLFEEIVLPLVVKIGENWSDGKLKIVNEHMASSVLVSFLREMLSAFRPVTSMPKLVVATPVNHWHELGALITSIVAADAGWAVFYFGPNLPAEEIAAAAVYKAAAAVALSVVYHDADRQALREIKRLRHYLTDDVAIIIGGNGVRSYQSELKQINVLHPLNFSEFRDTLDRLT
jgi:DNA-binding transcriptional MerR regulator/methylmalonyl-CoA mutase cobalamin-binding subunit